VNDLEHRRAFVPAPLLPGQDRDRSGQIPGRLNARERGDPVRKHAHRHARAVDAETASDVDGAMRNIALRGVVLAGVGAIGGTDALDLWQRGEPLDALQRHACPHLPA
jgi:hypothetical protein